jgi:aryl-alcohol dehydrogenase-like predicted oxidoreductase
MKLRQLGSSDLRVSVVGLGCNNFGSRVDLEGSRAVIEKALELGVTLFDTADIYGNAGGSEEILGHVLGSRRADIVLATKFGMQMGGDDRKKGASRAYIMRAVEDSLRRLNTTWIDLYQLHEPDPSTPIDETLRALDDLVMQGKVRHVGCSNLPAWQVVDSLWISQVKGLGSFVSCQDEFSLLKRDVEAELIPMMKAKGLGLLPYFPLASGFLTGKYKRDNIPAGTRIANSEGARNRWLTEKNWTIVENLERFAQSRGKSILDLAFAWLLAKPTVASVIAGATRPEQVHANVGAGEWELSAADIIEVDKIAA